MRTQLRFRDYQLSINEGRKEEKAMPRKTVGRISVVLLLLLLCGLGWWFVIRKHQLENVRQLQAEAFDRELGDEERREKFREFKDAYDQLSESQRRDLRRERSHRMQGRMTEHIHAYFELPKVKRIAFLDKQINEMEKKRRASSNRERGGDRRGRGGAPGFERGNREATSKADRQERRDRFKRGFLDHTTPQQRAEMAEYMEALRERREERGLPDFGRRRRATA